jgi:hypothetical protein
MDMTGQVGHPAPGYYSRPIVRAVLLDWAKSQSFIPASVEGAAEPQVRQRPPAVILSGSEDFLQLKGRGVSREVRLYREEVSPILDGV